MRNLRAQSSTNWFRPRHLPRWQLPTPRMVDRRSSKTPSNAASPGRSSAGSEFATPTDERAPAPADSSPLLGQACASERSELDRLRQEPSAEAAGLFWRNMRCEGLRPQVRLLLESLNAAADSVGSAAAPSEPEARGATSDVPTAIGVGSSSRCRL